MEIQLKILQTLPLLVQNYVADIHGDAMPKVLATVSILLNSKLLPVVSTASATIQQLVTALYEHLKSEDGTFGI